jgi:hypothetical protein
MIKYNLSVGAIFKNESHGIKEWIKHYLYHGVEHFYLINDNSSDNFMENIKEFDTKITLFNVDEPYYLGRQRVLYNEYILPIIKETKWLLMVDLDEYVWSKQDINLVNVLNIFENYGQIQICENVFGSNGYINQPKQIVKSFTKRRNHNEVDDYGRTKYFINPAYDFLSLNIHHADFTNKDYIRDISKYILTTRDYFVINHYTCQSREFWNNVKCTRGDADNYLVRKCEDFTYYDLNEVEDLGLYNQNLILYENDEKQ